MAQEVRKPIRRSRECIVRETIPMMVAVRGYAVPVKCDAPSTKQRTSKWTRKALPFPATESLVFDCGTTADHTQSLRFGTYQCRKRGKLIEEGIFYVDDNPVALSKADVAMIESYAKTRGLTLRTHREFVDAVFYRYAFAYGALVIGFNLPFDLSRLATRISTSHARDMRNAFSLTLSPEKFHPNVLVRHLNARSSFIRFAAAAGQADGRSARKRGEKTQARRGYFLDVKTLSAALLGRSHTLKSLADVL